MKGNDRNENETWEFSDEPIKKKRRKKWPVDAGDRIYFARK